ncbi:hypothetical protein GCM10010833_27420 [Blastomonas aquatica]|uniref:Uncharacterized protein n=3 Tax=Blastomonas aquatica TaxID=1510276 RepID=A0ABQ1JJK7_9SPHN|nr:hypothetical protein GCM10010833_27420 [Blastomonas aquatica]
MLLLVLLFTSASPPMNLDWFANEKIAGESLGAYLDCTGGGAFDRRADTRQSADVAKEILTACENEVAALQEALADIFRRKREFVIAGKSPDETAAFYIAEANAQLEPMVREGRKID